MIDFQTDPTRYRHWKLSFDGPVATLTMDVDPAGGLMDGYELKLNSYDLGVDIELADAVQRLRFEHPEVKTVVLRSGKEGVFCAGANIRMLGKASHGHKVNFCKFTNETRFSIEDASENSGQTYMAAIAGSAAGGGYELAVTADHIMLIDDRRSSVSLPELPLLAVLPGTGGLTRLTDKRRVRRDRADIFSPTHAQSPAGTAAEGRSGQQGQGRPGGARTEQAASRQGAGAAGRRAGGCAAAAGRARRARSPAVRRTQRAGAGARAARADPPDRRGAQGQARARSPTASATATASAACW